MKFFIYALMLFGFSLPLYAQSIKYQDESGNIFFVDNLQQVPERFRKQLVPPTPTPYMNPKQWRSYQKQMAKQQKLVERQRVKEERRKIRDLKLGGGNSMQMGSGNGLQTKQILTVSVFTNPSCPECAKLEKFLRDRKIKYKRYDIVRSREAFEAFDKLGAGSKLPVTKIGAHIIKGFQPDAILAAATALQLVPQEQGSGEL